MTTKTCTKCGETKTVDQFSKDRTKRDGRRPSCKTCTAAQRRAHYEANREQINARQRAYNEANREEISARKRAYRAGHREKISAQKRAYYESNREEISARNRAYNEANRDKINARNRTHRALVGNPSVERYQEVTARYATRNGEPWTPEEDRYILTGPGTLMDKALQLSRTYEAVAHRSTTLRRQENAA